MQAAIHERDREAGLARLVAGYAWDWKTRGNKPGFDFELEGNKFVWNRIDKDWINSRDRSARSAPFTLCRATTSTTRV